MQIGPLAEHPHFAETLARLHHAEWRALLPWWRLDDALAELQDHARRRTFPTTLVAVEGGRLLGSVSLIAEDAPAEELPGHAALTPWLASLFVLPEARGRGVGTALVSALVAHARALGFPRIHLFTEGQEAFYLRAGWSVLARADLRGKPIAILFRQLLPEDAGAAG